MSAVYTPFMAWLADALTSETFAMVGTNADFTLDITGDEVLDDIDAGWLVSDHASLGVPVSVTATANGVEVLLSVGALSGVASLETLTGILVYIDSGDPATSRLVMHLDTKADSSPINVEGTGSVIAVSWPYDWSLIL